MKKDDTAEGFLVTGFPRDIEQAAAFEERYNLFVKNENFNILHFFLDIFLKHPVNQSSKIVQALKKLIY